MICDNDLVHQIVVHLVTLNLSYQMFAHSDNLGKCTMIHQTKTPTYNLLEAYIRKDQKFVNFPTIW